MPQGLKERKEKKNALAFAFQMLTLLFLSLGSVPSFFTYCIRPALSKWDPQLQHEKHLGTC